MNTSTDLRFYINLLKERKWIIICTTLILVVITSLVSIFLIKPKYKVESTIAIVNTNIPETVNGEYSNQKYLSTYSELFKSRNVLASIIEKLDIDITVSELQKKIKVDIVENTDIIHISIVDENKFTAFNIMKNIPNIALEKANNINTLSKIVFIDEPEVPQKPSSPNIGLNIVISMILGLILGVLLILINECLNQKIRYSREITNYFGIYAMRSIQNRKIKKNNKNILLDEIDECKNIAVDIELAKKEKNIKTILITSSIEKEGKSSIAINIAKCLADIDNTKVLLIDTNLENPSIYNYFELSNEDGFYEMLSYPQNIEKCIKTTIINNLSVMTCGISNDISQKIINYNQVTNIINKLYYKFDYIIFDSSNLNSSANSEVISTCVDATIIVAQSRKLRIKELEKSINKLNKAKANILGIVLNKSKSKYDK